MPQSVVVFVFVILLDSKCFVPCRNSSLQTTVSLFLLPFFHRLLCLPEHLSVYGCLLSLFVSCAPIYVSVSYASLPLSFTFPVLLFASLLRLHYTYLSVISSCFHIFHSYLLIFISLFISYHIYHYPVQQNCIRTVLIFFLLY